MNLTLILVTFTFLLCHITAATKRTVEKRDNYDNRDSYPLNAQIRVNYNQIIHVSINHRREIYPMDPIIDIEAASVLLAPIEFACFFSASGRLPSEPFDRNYRLPVPYAEAENLICYTTPDPNRMLAIWVRYASGKEDVLFLIIGRGNGIIRFVEDYGRYISAVKVVAEPRESFACRLESDDGDFVFSVSNPLIGVTNLIRAISCTAPLRSPYFELGGYV